MLWLDHIEAIAKKMGFNHLETGMSKLKGTALYNINVSATAHRTLF